MPPLNQPSIQSTLKPTTANPSRIIQSTAIPISQGNLVCGISSENSVLVLTCPHGQAFSSIVFASYGTPSGISCSTFQVSTDCHASTSLAVVQSLCLNLTSCSISVSNDVFKLDPCLGTAKHLSVSAECSDSTASWGNWTDKSGNMYGPAYMHNPLLLTDGRVMGVIGNRVFALSPDIFGSYTNGTWSELAHMPVDNRPVYFASAVLPSGQVIISGGEYNTNGNYDRTVLYDPVTNSWSDIPKPSFATVISDAPSVVLPNGQFMLGLCVTSPAMGALLNITSLTWTQKKFFNKIGAWCDEDGWTMLPNGDMLSVPTSNGGQPVAEVYNFATDTWSVSGSTVNMLPADGEMGPEILKPDGVFIAFGASGNVALYDTVSSVWSAGTPMPLIDGNRCHTTDAPTAVLPNGNVLFACATGPGFGNSGAFFFETDGFTYKPITPALSNDFPYQYSMLVLPTGEIFMTNPSSIYTPSAAQKQYQDAWRPVIASIQKTTLCAADTNIKISGTLFNGMTTGAAYGDDVQAATNYPLVRITNMASLHVFYCRTHDHSSMAVQDKTSTVSTYFDVNRNIEVGASTLVVVTNGIPSQPITVTISKTCS